MYLPISMWEGKHQGTDQVMLRHSTHIGPPGDKQLEVEFEEQRDWSSWKPMCVSTRYWVDTYLVVCGISQVAMLYLPGTWHAYDAESSP